MPKQTIRDRLLKQREQLSPRECQRLSALIQELLHESTPFRRARNVALYSPIRNEVQTDLLFSAARQDGKRVYYPRVEGERMVFVEVDDPAALRKGRFGLLEPPAGKQVPVAELDLLAVPGVAFDRDGFRLGYGKGFYDRELHAAGFSGTLVGLCFDFQLFESLPVELHDVPVHLLVTEQGLYTPIGTISGPAGSP